MSPKKSAESGFSTKEKLIATGAGLALALGLTACSAEGGNKTPEPTETSTSQPTPTPTETTPTPTPTTPETTAPTGPAVSENLVDPNYQLPDERKQELLSYDKLSIEEFDALPKSEQLAWMHFRSGMNGGGNIYEYAADYYNITKDAPPSHAVYDSNLDIYPESVNPDNSFQEIMTIQTYNTRQIVRMKPGDMRDKVLLATRYSGLAQNFFILKSFYEDAAPVKHYPNAIDNIGNNHKYGNPDIDLIGAMERDTVLGDIPRVSGRAATPEGGEVSFNIYYIEFENPFTGETIGTWINY
jgi:hypothetical protein